MCVCVCVCRKTDNKDPSGRNDLLTGQHYSKSSIVNLKLLISPLMVLMMVQ